MGEVYRARDNTLQRDVAVKVLPERMADDEEGLLRLEREARLLASLNHRNIATIYSLEREGDTRFLVMELIDGETLAERLKSGSLPVEQALELARQIAEALEAAHEAGVIHRDLKPSNVMITPRGDAKVLDFGIAKTVSIEAAPEDATHTPTEAYTLTVAGMLLGTAAYMSPEQVRGEQIDKRSDNWAFGCLLYEALTGTSAFGRETLGATLAAILELEPDWGRLPPVHPRIRLLLERCLEKKARDRCHDIADARVDVQKVL